MPELKNNHSYISSNAFKRILSVTRTNIFNIFLREGHKPNFFHSLLNQILILARSPICIALYEGNTNSKSTNKKFRYLDREFIVEINHRERYHDIISNKFNYDGHLTHKNYPHLIQIYKSKFWILVFKIDAHTVSNTRELNFTLIKNNSSDGIHNYIYACFSGIFDRTEKDIALSYAYENYPVFKKSVERSIKNLRPIPLKCSPTTKIKDVKISEFFNETIKEFGEINNGIYDKLYQQSKKVIYRLFGEAKNTKLSNINFFIRYYGRDDLRYRIRKEGFEHGYNYDTKVLIPETQRRDLVDFFRGLIAHNKETPCIEESMKKYVTKYGSLYSDIKDRQLIPHDIKSSIDLEFWNTLLKPNGPNELVDKLGANFSKDTRSFTDAVFTNGVIHYRHPYQSETRGLDRIIGYEKFHSKDNFNDLPNSLKPSLLQKVIGYYYFNSLAAKLDLSDSENSVPPHIITFPIEISGTVSCVVSLSLRMPEHHLVSEKIHFAEVFDKINYYQENVVSYIEKELRREYKRKYFEIIFSTAEDIMKSVISLYQSSNTPDANLKLQTLNNSLSELSSRLIRIYPYPQLNIYFVHKNLPTDEKKISTGVIIGDHFDLRYTISHNQFFNYLYSEKEKSRTSYLKHTEIVEYAMNLSKNLVSHAKIRLQ